MQKVHAIVSDINTESDIEASNGATVTRTPMHSRQADHARLHHTASKYDSEQKEKPQLKFIILKISIIWYIILNKGINWL